jgi:type III restriction enzyme
MPNSNQFLYQEYDILSKRISKQIPNFVVDNLNPKFPIRPYQKEAFARFFDYLTEYEERLIPSHLLFNMATGSGKTLIMAGLVLYLYEQGYRNFLFFVNSNNIIEKTKDNFLNSQSSKYLFNQKISFNDRLVSIKQVDNFQATNDQNINICFTTIQKLHSDLHNEKENSLTFEDFKDKKIVLLSDEAHHSQTKTKNKSKDVFEETKPSWENTVEKIFFQDKENLLLEFTATLDFTQKEIDQKYKNKILYRYDLKEFRNDGYSKDVNILQSDFDEMDRMLQAVILNQYRQEVAMKAGIQLKPIILFKAQKTIEESKQNQLKFNNLIEDLSTQNIQNLREKSGINIIQKAFSFFGKNNLTDDLLVQKLKSNFAPNKCLNVNEENLDKKSLKNQDRQELLSQQHTLNSLEDKNNQIRAIFAVQKLNEGWDVLNLFDIVRLYTTRDSDNGKPGKTTIAEAQLIGRGARYFPFEIKENELKYSRKFDEDLENDLRILEELHYHSVNDNRYISELRRALIEKGLLDDNIVEKELKLKDEFKQTQFFKTSFIYTNKQTKSTFENITSLSDFGISKRNMEYKIASGFGDEKTVFGNKEFVEKTDISEKRQDIALSDLPYFIIKKAVTKNGFYSYKNISGYFPNISSLIDFIKNKEYLGNLKITFIGKKDDIDNIKNAALIDAVSNLLAEIEKGIKGNITEYKGTEKFEPANINKIFFDKILRINETDERLNGQESFVRDKKWFAFASNYGTSEEKDFVILIDKLMLELEKKYQEIYLLRNELHFKIYNFNDGRAFAPDFVLFLKEKEGQSLTYQIFIEPKGSHLIKQDKWKEDFLIEIKEKFKDKVIKFSENKQYRITGVPFYNAAIENEFEEEFKEIVKI